MDDIRAVLDDAGVDRAAFLAAHEGTRLAILFAATYPERTRALVLHEPSVRGRRAPDYPGPGATTNGAIGFGKSAHLGRRGVLRADAPRLQSDGRRRPGIRPLVRPPHAFERESECGRRVPADGDGGRREQRPHRVRVPTLVLHRSMSLGSADFVTKRIPGARRVEIPGLVDGYSWANPLANQVLLDETQRFLAGLDETKEPDTILGTFLFTDIVGSTARCGDRGCRVAGAARATPRLGSPAPRRVPGRGGGTAGDGFFATFDGPGRAIRCACALRNDVRGIGLEIRAGLHSGEGQVIDGQIGGLAVGHRGARGGPRRPERGARVRDRKGSRCGSGFEFADRGEHDLRVFRASGGSMPSAGHRSRRSRGAQACGDARLTKRRTDGGASRTGGAACPGCPGCAGCASRTAVAEPSCSGTAAPICCDAMRRSGCDCMCCCQRPRRTEDGV